jgi:hypothetical protein
MAEIGLDESPHPDRKRLSRTYSRVREPGVAERLRLVDPPAERRQDALDRVAQVALVREVHRRTLEPAAALHPHRSGAAHHHLLDGGVAEQRLQRAEAERALRDPAGQLVARARVEHRRLAVDELADAAGQVLRRGVVGAGEQPVAQVGGELVEVVHTLGRRSTEKFAPQSARGGMVRSLPTIVPPALAWSPGGRARSRISPANAAAAAR